MIADDHFSNIPLVGNIVYYTNIYIVCVYDHSNAGTARKAARCIVALVLIDLCTY